MIRNKFLLAVAGMFGLLTQGFRGITLEERMNRVLRGIKVQYDLVSLDGIDTIYCKYGEQTYNVAWERDKRKQTVEEFRERYIKVSLLCTVNEWVNRTAQTITSQSFHKPVTLDDLADDLMGKKDIAGYGVYESHDRKMDK